jgi:hypothetical protein
LSARNPTWDFGTVALYSWAPKHLLVCTLKCCVCCSFVVINHTVNFTVLTPPKNIVVKTFYPASAYDTASMNVTWEVRKWQLYSVSSFYTLLERGLSTVCKSSFATLETARLPRAFFMYSTTLDQILSRIFGTRGCDAEHKK